MPVGNLANCSGHSAYVSASTSTPLSDILRLITRSADESPDRGDIHPAYQSTIGPVRRVPIVDSAGEVVHVFSCSDFLELALRCTGPTAVLKSCAARRFDSRSTMLQVSALHDDAVISALRIMDSEHLTICPATSRELSGDLGGVVASNVLSVTDLKWVISTGSFGILDGSVSDFIAWRTGVASTSMDRMLRQHFLSRVNVISVHADDSLHMLAQRLMASKLQRIFLSSADLGRIVGIVGSRDILLEVINQLL
jgi:CBS domain-containing protein